jgi:integrase
MTAPGRKPAGQIRAHRTKSGILTYSVRVRWQGNRVWVRLGDELGGWNRPLAERKLTEILAEIERGVWRPPLPDLDPEDTDPIFHEFATVWMDRHGVGLDKSTRDSYSHVLSHYVLPEFKDRRLTEITHEAVRRWRDRLRQEAERLNLAKDNDVTILDAHGQPRRPFGPSTINEALRLLGQILERAVESEHYAIQRSPVKGRRGLRVKRPGRPPREHLEADEVLSLLRAAEMLDQGVTPRTLGRAETARELRARDMTWGRIGEHLGCAETTAIYLSRVRPHRDAPRKRRAMIAVLSLTGVRASEHTDLQWRRLDHTHGRLVVTDSKTDAGMREIHLSPFVREELALYRASLAREPGSNEPIFPIRGGGQNNRFNLNRRLKRIAAVAAELREAEGLAPMPARITPHTFRRTFVTLCFQAGKDLPFVQSQVGHSNWQTTLEIYTRQSGRSIDPEIRRLLDEFLGEPKDEPALPGPRRRSRSERRLPSG